MPVDKLIVEKVVRHVPLLEASKKLRFPADKYVLIFVPAIGLHVQKFDAVVLDKVGTSVIESYVTPAVTDIPVGVQLLPLPELSLPIAAAVAALLSLKFK